MKIGRISFGQDYGEIGYFSRFNPQTSKYKYANWGSRKWEYYYVEKILTDIGIKGKQVVDVGIGRPIDSDFYKFYVKSGCFLTGFDPDGRLKPVTVLSKKCKIIRSSAEKMKTGTKKADIVVVISAFEHFPEKVFKQTIKEIYRIIKDNGHLIVTLDMTVCNHKKSAPWAILEKTINKIPPQENSLPLPKNYAPLSLERFLKLVSLYFYVKDSKIFNSELNRWLRVYSWSWNSCVAYIHLYKK